LKVASRISSAFAQVNERLGGIARRLDSLEHMIALLSDRVDRKLTWLTGIVVGTWITTILTVLFGHWQRHRATNARLTPNLILRLVDTNPKANLRSPRL
jgi:tetrahydromethanopterin S-methyltransferase subunit G